jgi:hypothetical protein
MTTFAVWKTACRPAGKPRTPKTAVGFNSEFGVRWGVGTIRLFT